MYPIALSGAAEAQSAPKTVEGRVDRLEQEMRAVQRKVFPSGQVVAPEVGPAAPLPATPAGTPATSPVADLTARVSAIEAQLAQLTGQVEENGHRLTKLEDAVAKLNAPPPVAAVAPVPAMPSVAPGPATPAGRPQPAAPRPQPAAAGGPSSAARNEQVAAVERPSTGNAALDGYTYGFRLWSAKFYPEAETQLLATLEKYGSDPVASRTQNLLGRAYLDEGKPVTAAKTFYENYRLRPKGDRAAESLAWTAEALMQAKDNARACAAYDELADVFSASMPASVRDMMVKGRVRAKCGA
nr:hypothetical protein [Sphingobium nicotianae]